MAFYATLPVPPIIFPAIALTGYYEILAGQVAVFPFTLAPNGQIVINVVQQQGTQDHTIRVWVSKEPYGTSVVLNPQNVTYWNPNHIANQIVTVFDTTMPQHPAVQTPLALLPGDYFLNIQNLENRSNVVYSLLTVL
jgi:hypothetical protein